MSYLKYSSPLGNDLFRLRSLFCSSCLVLLRPCWAGPGAAWGGPCPSHLSNGALGKRGKQADSSVSWHISWAAPGAGCKLVQFRAAMRYILSFANGHNVWCQIGSKQPKKRKTCHSLHPNKVCWELHQHTQGFSTGNPDLDFPFQDKHNTLSALFSDPMLGKPSAASVQGRGVLQHGCRLFLLSLFACLWQPVRHRMLPLPWWELQSHGTLLSAAMLGIQLWPHRFFHPSRAHSQKTLGDWFPQKTEAPRAYKGTSCEFKGLCSLQFGLPMVHQEVPQETSVWWQRLLCDGDNISNMLMHNAYCTPQCRGL